MFTSTKAITGTGLKKCRPPNLSFLCVTWAISEIGNEDVLETKIVWLKINDIKTWGTIKSRAWATCKNLQEGLQQNYNIYMLIFDGYIIWYINVALIYNTQIYERKTFQVICRRISEFVHSSNQCVHQYSNVIFKHCNILYIYVYITLYNNMTITCHLWSIYTVHTHGKMLSIC